jgi:uncharacterized protein YuzB (UPF0349 family)
MSNMSHGTDEIMRRLEQNPDYDVIEYGCLGNCGYCSYSPYALVNGELIDAKTPEKLYDKILAKIKQLEEQFALLDDQLN